MVNSKLLWEGEAGLALGWTAEGGLSYDDLLFGGIRLDFINKFSDF